MGRFFHGWRRKAGCVTLFLACLFAGVWSRSLVMSDIASFTGPSWYHVIYVGNGGITWTMISRYANPRRVSARWLSSRHSAPRKTGNVENRASSILQFLPHPSQARHVVWRVHFWSIVIPLTLLSAYLLLSKPRVTKPTPVTEN